jgi:hypothetical protein
VANLKRRTKHVEAYVDALPDAGSIPAASTNLSPFISGQNPSNPGQNESQPGQSKELVKEALVEEGTENALQQSHPGNITSIISAQQEHNETGLETSILPNTGCNRNMETASSGAKGKSPVAGPRQLAERNMVVKNNPRNACGQETWCFAVSVIATVSSALGEFMIRSIVSR